MAVVALDNVLGAAFIGIILGSILYGITLFQLYRYYSKFNRRDGLPLKIFIAGLMVTDTLHLVLVCHFYYYYTVSHFGDFLALSVATWSISAHITVGAVCSSMVQFFYAYRIRKLSRGYAIPVVVCILSVAQTAIGIATTYKISTVKFFVHAQLSAPFGIAALACEVACDLVITFAMVFYLHRSRTGFSRSNKALTMLISYMINTGALTTLFAIATVIGWIVTPDELIDIAFYIVMVRLYPCSFLSILNSRDKVLITLNGPHGAGAETVHLSSLTVVHRDPISTQESSGKFSSDGESNRVDTQSPDVSKSS